MSAKDDDALVRKLLRELQLHAPLHVKLLRGAITRIKRRAKPAKKRATS
jgi:hypothetical protein